MYASSTGWSIASNGSNKQANSSLPLARMRFSCKRCYMGGDGGRRLVERWWRLQQYVYATL